jgi:hypothetical protein
MMCFVNNNLIDVKRRYIGRQQSFTNMCCRLLPGLAGNRYVLLAIPCETFIDIGSSHSELGWIAGQKVTSRPERRVASRQQQAE